MLQGLLSENDRIAAHNRAHFDQHGVLAINLMSSPGAGKTALLEATIDALEGRVQHRRDRRRPRNRERRRAHPRQAACRRIQITTGNACHLDAHMVHDALHHLPLAGLDMLFIENVGNLVCPASFDLGQHRNVTLLSVTEGDDKPAKYPVMFRAADLVLLTKTDLLAVLDDFEPERARTRTAPDLANPAPIDCGSSARKGLGMDAWLDLAASARSPRSASAWRSGQVAPPGIQPDGVPRARRGTAAALKLETR
ncbi:MAG: hydrogenase nickel incorporation protein HypB [Chromatiales bacterium]|nr:hydrogenase nickel incorporation protein HypB [Chromatiales bacterium]